MRQDEMSSRDQRRKCPLGVVVTVAILALCITTASATSPGVDNETCFDCHDEQEVSLHRGPHRLSSTIKNPAIEVSCVSCHAGADIHIEDPSTDNITNPASLSGRDAQNVCGECHVPHTELDNYGFDMHTTIQLNCSSCHKVHSPDGNQLLNDKADFCFACHDDIKTSFSRRSNHPLFQGNVTCLSCHRFVKRHDHNQAFDLNRVCQDCHPEQSGPFPYEHNAANAYAVDGSGCVECHEPHGSEYSRLLKQPGAELCLQCHITPPGHDNMPALHGDVRNIETCYACHTDVHGSFTSHKLLDPALQAKLGSPQNCYQSGCHSISD
jgi:DmsE family decaheme c-type cytochrome